jgi:hypothetical protein
VLHRHLLCIIHTSHDYEKNFLFAMVCRGQLPMRFKIFDCVRQRRNKCTIARRKTSMSRRRGQGAIPPRSDLGYIAPFTEQDRR